MYAGLKRAGLISALFCLSATMGLGQTRETNIDALVHVKVLTAFDVACLRNAPDFSSAGAGFAVSGWQQVMPGRFVGEAGRIIAFVQSENDDSFRLCAVALREADTASLLDRAPGLIHEAWESRGEIAIERNPEGPVYLSSVQVVEGVHYAAEMRDQGNGITTLSVSAAATEGFDP